MKKIFCLITAVILSEGVLFSQTLNYGLNPKVNSSTQFHRIQSISSDGSSGHMSLKENSIITWGLSGYAERKTSDHLSTFINAGFCQKGYSFPLQTYDSILGQKNYDFKLKFNYLNLDLTERLSMNKNTVNPFIQAGLRFDYLLSKDIDKEFSEMGFDNLYGGDDYKKFDIGLLVAFGIEIKKLFWLSAEFNLDLLRPVCKKELGIRNQLWTLNAGVNINKLFKSSK